MPVHQRLELRDRRRVDVDAGHPRCRGCGASVGFFAEAAGATTPVHAEHQGEAVATGRGNAEPGCASHVTSTGAGWGGSLGSERLGATSHGTARVNPRPRRARGASAHDAPIARRRSGDWPRRHPTRARRPAPAWEQRFRASAILLSSIAIDAPDIGLVTSNASGIPQLYRWDTASGELTQLTFDPGGRLVGRLSPDGRWVTWLADTERQRDRPLGRDPVGRRRARSTSAPGSRRTPRSRSRSAVTAAGSGSSRRPTTGSPSASRRSATTAASASSRPSTTRRPT